MKRKIKILFTSAGRRVELMQTFRAASENMRISLELYGADVKSTAPALSICNHTVLVPRISDPAYIPMLLEVCEKEHIDALIPTIDTDLHLLSTKADVFAGIGTRVVISREEKVVLCRDKRITADYFNSIGLHTPFTVDNIRDYHEGFPAFLKPRDGSSSVGAHKIESEEDLIAYSKEVADYIVQPFIDGTEYTVDVFCDFTGNPIYITPRIRQAIRAGEVLKTKICQDEQIISEMKQLIADFKPCGAITVQLIRDKKTNVDWYIEINPRFGGGAPLSMKAGANSACAMLRLLTGEPVTYQPGAASDGAVYSRFDQCVCVDPGIDALKRLDAVIFDLDDTLYPEKTYVRSGYREVAKLLPDIKDAEVRLWDAFLAGRPAIDCVLQDAGIDDPSLKARCLETYREHEPEICLYDGAAELIRKLRRNGKKVAILTDGRPSGQRKKIHALGLADLVDEILVTDELGGVQFRKPNDVGFRILKYRLGVPYERIAYVGDNPSKDFHAPLMLGMPYIYYQNPDSLYSKAAHAPITVHELKALEGILF